MISKSRLNVRKHSFLLYFIRLNQGTCWNLSFDQTTANANEMIVIDERSPLLSDQWKTANRLSIVSCAATVYFIVHLAQPSFYPFTRTTRVQHNRVQCIAKAEPWHLHCCRAFAFSSVFFVLCVQLFGACRSNGTEKKGKHKHNDIRLLPHTRMHTWITLNPIVFSFDRRLLYSTRTMRRGRDKHWRTLMQHSIWICACSFAHSFCFQLFGLEYEPDERVLFLNSSTFDVPVAKQL